MEKVYCWKGVICKFVVGHVVMEECLFFRRKHGFCKRDGGSINGLVGSNFCFPLCLLVAGIKRYNYVVINSFILQVLDDTFDKLIHNSK